MANHQQLPTIYVDIDGVLLANESNLAIGAVEFIKFVADNFEVFWLTTHCMHGDPKWAVEYVNRAAKEDLKPYLNIFKPTTWSLKKTEAIDFSKPFLWFDDDCYSGEKQDLQKNDAINSWIEIDLIKHQDQLVKEMPLLESYL